MAAPRSVQYLHVLGALSERGAGVAKAVWDLVFAQARLIQKQGLVHLVGLNDPDWSGQKPNGEGISLHAARYWGPLSFGFAPSLNRILREYAFSASLLHSHGLWGYPNWVAASFARRMRHPLVISTHGMLSPEALRHSQWKKWPAYRLIEKRDLSRASCLLAASPREAADIAKLNLGSPVAVIPFGIRADEFPDPREEPSQELEREWEALLQRNPDWREKRLLLFLGRLHPIKAPDQLLDVWAEIADQFPDAHLIFAGPDQLGMLERLTARVRRNDLAARVSFLSSVTGITKVALLRKATLLILSSRSENFGMVVLEALASGTPVLASDRTPWEILQAAGAGWNYPFGVEGLRSKLETILSSPPEQLRATGLKGRQLTERDFAWDSLARKTLELYSWIQSHGRKPDFVCCPRD